MNHGLHYRDWDLRRDAPLEHFSAEAVENRVQSALKQIAGQPQQERPAKTDDDHQGSARTPRSQD